MLFIEKVKIIRKIRRAEDKIAEIDKDIVNTKREIEDLKKIRIKRGLHIPL